MSLSNTVAVFETKINSILASACTNGHLIPTDEAMILRSRLYCIASSIAAVSNALNSTFPNELLVGIFEMSLRYNLSHNDRRVLYDTLSSTSKSWRTLVHDTMPLPISIDEGETRSVCWALSRLANSRPSKILWLHWSPVVSWGGIGRETNSIGTPPPVRRGSLTSFHLPRININFLSQMVDALVSRKSFIEAVDIVTGVDIMFGWQKIVSGHLPYLKMLRIWKCTGDIERLEFAADALTILHLNKCLPLAVSCPLLTNLVLHGLRHDAWTYDELLQLIRSAPRIVELDLEGQLASVDVVARPVHLPELLHLKVETGRRGGGIMEVCRDLITPAARKVEWWPISSLSPATYSSMTNGLNKAVVSSRLYEGRGAAILHHDTLILSKWPNESGDGAFLHHKKPSVLYYDALDSLHCVSEVAGLLECFPSVVSIHMVGPIGGYGPVADWFAFVEGMLLRGIALTVYNRGVAVDSPAGYPGGVVVVGGDWCINTRL